MTHQTEQQAGADVARRADDRIRAATLLIDALTEHMPDGSQRRQCAVAVGRYILDPAIRDMEAMAGAPPRVRPIWLALAVVAALGAALFYVSGALAFVDACHGAGVPVPNRWPF